MTGRQYDAGTGATVFVPHGNWIGIENDSSEPAMILFFFNQPAFEQCLPPCPRVRVKRSPCPHRRKWRWSKRSLIR